MTQAIWTPSKERVEKANITKFSELVRDRHLPGLTSYKDLYEWSIDKPELFWAEIWDFCGIISEQRENQQKWDKVLVEGDKMPGAKWFPDARLNFAENLLRYRDDNEAIVFRSEKGERKSYTYKELYNSVSHLAAYLKEQGVTTNDRIAGYLPNLPETIISMLACSSLGATWSSCSPDFGIEGACDRFSQIEPKVLIVADAYYYNGKTIDCLENAHEVIKKISSIKQVIVVPFANKKPNLSKLKKAVLFTDIVSKTTAPELSFEQLPFDHPLYIMYSSGTTGIPKCIVHGAGGTLIQHLKELVLHTDITREDKIFYYTTCGWMMWNWLVSSLATGATVLLYDGSPFYPDGNALFDFAEKERMSIFGTSAKYISALEKAGIHPNKSHDLSHLKTITSTGSPLVPENYDYVYQKIKSDVCLSSISGGTDIISCFALGNPALPVYPGELQCRGLGMKVEVYDEKGQSIRNKKGELVCTAPFPSMPIYFWNDPGGKRYCNSYFDKYKNVWRHGDWVELTDHEGLIVYGRSDTTLNPGGVRIGTAEIYRQVEQLDQILESLVIGQEWMGDERILLFVVLKEGLKLETKLIQEIKTKIKNNCTQRHVPAKVVAVPDLPRTISGKIAELAVKNAVHKRPVKNISALANPDVLECFRDIKELETD